MYFQRWWPNSSWAIKYSNTLKSVLGSRSFMRIRVFVFYTGCIITMFYSHSIIRFCKPFLFVICACPAVRVCRDFAVFCYSCFQNTFPSENFVFDLFANCLKFNGYLPQVNTVEAFILFFFFNSFSPVQSVRWIRRQPWITLHIYSTILI